MKYLFCALLFLFIACKHIDKEEFKVREAGWSAHCAKIDGGNMYWLTKVHLMYMRTMCFATVRRDWDYCKNEADYRKAAEDTCSLLGADFSCRAESYFNEGDNMTITYECYAQ